MFMKKANQGAEEAAPATSEEAAAFIKDYLNEEGYRAEIDDDGDVRFKKEGTTYFVSCDKRQKFYIVKLYAGFGIGEDLSSAEREKNLLAANEANDKYILGRAALHFERGYVAFDVVNLYKNPQDFASQFSFQIDCLESCRQCFFEKC